MSASAATIRPIRRASWCCIDGRQVYADYYGFTPWSTLPVELSDIRQIEIVEGPNSALFGFNAVGGVINIVTYDPLYDDVNTASITGGTQNLVQGSGVATFRMGDTAGLRVSLGGRGNDDFSTPQNPLDVGTRQGDQAPLHRYSRPRATEPRRSMRAWKCRIPKPVSRRSSRSIRASTPGIGRIPWMPASRPTRASDF